MQHLINKLPFDIIVNNILPYTYRPQPKKLLYDIKSYITDYLFLENVYMTQYNEFVLLNDLTKFCEKNLEPSYGIKHKFEIVLRRHISIVNKNDEELINMIRLNFHRNIENNADRKVKFLWGLLKRHERTSFINKYILSDYDF